MQLRQESKERAAKREKTTTLTISTRAGKCFLCKGEHFLCHCEKFLAMSIDVRFKVVQRLKLCINCLRSDHFAKTCRMGSCRECSRRHNTLLHRPDPKKGDNGKPTDCNSSNKSSNVSVYHASNDLMRQHVIMATAVVDAARANGSSIAIRILLDSASEANFVTQSACNKLGVKRDKTSEIITGLNAV